MGELERIAPASLAAARSELAELRDGLLPAIKRLIAHLNTRSEDNGGLELTRSEKDSFEVIDRLYQRMIQAAKADAEIARMQGDQITEVELREIVDRVGYYVFRGLDWTTDEVGPALEHFLSGKQHWFADGVNVPEAIGKIVKVARKPSQTAKQRLKDVWRSGELIRRDAPSPQDADESAGGDDGK